MKKKFLAVLMAAVMCASLAGCGEKQSKNTSGDASQPKQEKEGSDASKEEAIKTTLTVWSPSEDQSEEQGKWLQTMCEQFLKEHPNWDITFKYGVCPEAEAKATVTQDVEAAADVYMFANDNLADLISANAISKLGGETAEYVKSTNSQSIVDSVSVDGNIYGVPFTTNTWFMYYNKSVISEEEAGNLDKMMEKGKVSFPLSNSWYLAAFYLANGGTMYGDGTDESAGIVFNGENGIAVTNYLVDLVGNKNFVNDADGVGLSGLRDGSIHAMFSGSWDFSAVKEALGDNFAVKSLPTITIDGSEKQLMAFAGSKAIAVNPNSEYPQVSVALAMYLGGVEAQKSHYELRSVVPCNSQLLEDSAVKQDTLVTAQNETFNNTSIIQPFVPAMSNYWGPCDNFGKSLINKEITHENAADKTEEFNTAMNSSLAQ